MNSGRPKGGINKKYSPEFKIQIVEDMMKNKLGYRETQRKYDLPDHKYLQKWERIYLVEGKEGFCIERRGRALKIEGRNKGRTLKLKPEVEKDIIAELQFLRMENEYLKKLKALVQKRELEEKKQSK